MDDRDLIGACQQGCEDAWAELYARHQPRLWGYFRTLTQNDPAADFAELCQETWSQVVRSLPSYDARLEGDAAFFPWLAVLARHRLLAELRRRASRVQVVFGLPDPSEQIDVANTAISRVFARALVEQLPDPLDRQIVELRVWHDLYFEEIAQALGIGYRAVKNHWYDALEQLRGILHAVATPTPPPAKSLSPELKEEARRRYLSGEMNVRTLATVYGVAFQTMQGYVHGLKVITCARCGEQAAPARVNSPLCTTCQQAIEVAELRWCPRCVQGQPKALFKAHSGMCKPCQVVYDRGRREERQARRKARYAK